MWKDEQTQHQKEFIILFSHKFDKFTKHYKHVLEIAWSQSQVNSTSLLGLLNCNVYQADIAVTVQCSVSSNSWFMWLCFIMHSVIQNAPNI
jgi:hypothetical protein